MILIHYVMILVLQKQNIILVGDTEHDAKGAAHAGIKFCAVTWGFGYDQLHVSSDFNIDLTIQSPLELML